MAAVEVFLHEAVSSWLHRSSDRGSAAFGHEYFVDGIERIVRLLEERGRDLAMPQSELIRTTEYDLHELRWPDMHRGRGPKQDSGVPIVRLLYGFCVAPSGEVVVIVLAGDKTLQGNPNEWYDANVPLAEQRLREWSDARPYHHPIMKDGLAGSGLSC